MTSSTATTSPSPLTVAAFYKFVAVDDPRALQGACHTLCFAQNIKGTILIAREGINATVSGDDAAIAALIAELRADGRFRKLEVKYSSADTHPFRRLKVKIKPEIVTLGIPGIEPERSTAPAVAPEDWNALISTPGVVLIDTRNDYEVDVGTFAGAINPQTRSFREFPAFVERTLAADRSKKIAMFCTGGIRCEKASAYLLQEGFTNVYQLKGGILNYLERVPAGRSFWRGECFVFDERVALEHGVRRGHHGLCSLCGRPVRLSQRDDCDLPRCAACCGSDGVSHLDASAG